MSDFLLIAGVAVLSLALRSFAHPVLFKLGSFCILATSFLIGYRFTGYWEVGALCAASWLLLPWLEILTRVRQLRLPADQPLRHRYPPTRDTFPALSELSHELEDEGFAFVDDAGWDWEDHRQFLRLFYKADESLQAAICLIEQDSMAFYYVSLSSRSRDGKVWTTWNYPFSKSMKNTPGLTLNRLRGERTILELLASHRDFLARKGVGCETLVRCEPETLSQHIRHDLQAQIAHNIDVGLLRPADEGTVRYSWRGLLFLWVQFLRDFVRLS